MYLNEQDATTSLFTLPIPVLTLPKHDLKLLLRLVLEDLDVLARPGMNREA